MEYLASLACDCVQCEYFNMISKRKLSNGGGTADDVVWELSVSVGSVRVHVLCDW